jgi:hypothetical protein
MPRWIFIGGKRENEKAVRCRWNKKKGRKTVWQISAKISFFQQQQKNSLLLPKTVSTVLYMSTHAFFGHAYECTFSFNFGIVVVQLQIIAQVPIWAARWRVCPMCVCRLGVARFLLVHDTKTRKNVQNEHGMYQMVIKYSQCL